MRIRRKWIRAFKTKKCGKESTPFNHFINIVWAELEAEIPTKVPPIQFRIANSCTRWRSDRMRDGRIFLKTSAPLSFYIGERRGGIFNELNIGWIHLAALKLNVDH
jgi:hypothetical protein